MKSILTSIAAGALLATLTTAQPQPRYTVTDLGTLDGKFSQAFNINDKGVISGLATVADGTQHAVLWQKGKILDIGIPGGLNSAAFGANERGQVMVQAESTRDPNKENFCAYGTGLRCQAFVWQDGVLTGIPLLGGNNGTVGTINNRGQVAGIAENGHVDNECTTGVTVSGTGPQVLDFEAVIWGPGPGEIRPLPPLGGDTVAMAIGINDNGQAVGASGRCSNTILPPVAYGPHAVLWEKDGSVRDLGNLGAAVLNMSLSINNQGQVVGISSLTKDSTPLSGSHAFLWPDPKTGKMKDLGTLPGDVVSVGVCISEKGEVVGPSFDKDGNPRAYLWQNGVMTDLNTLAPGSPLFLLFPTSINSRGEIVGFGATSDGHLHAFLATPTPRTKASAGPKDATVIARQIVLDGTESASADGKPLTYQWSIPPGNPSAAILQGNTATPTVQFSSSRGVYTFQLTVTDSTGMSVSDVVTVNFQGN